MFDWLRGKEEPGQRPEVVVKVAAAVDFDALLRELLDVELRRANVSRGSVNGWLMLRGVKAAVLAEGLAGFWVAEASTSSMDVALLSKHENSSKRHHS